MALSAREVPISREEVAEWLGDFDGQQRATKKLRDYMADKITEKGLDPEAMVNTSTNDSLNDETAVVDMILFDIESYG